MYIAIAVKRTQELSERLPSGQNLTNRSTKRNKVLLDYNTKYEIGVSESKLIQINDSINK